MAKVGIERTVIYIYLVPVVTGIIAVFIGIDNFTLMKLLGVAVVISGMLFARKKTV